MKEPKLRKQEKKKDKLPKENSNILKGELDPEDPINNSYLNNLKVLADPLYTPENYIFVNKFNKEMDKLMDNLHIYASGLFPYFPNATITNKQKFLDQMGNIQK